MTPLRATPIRVVVVDDHPVYRNGVADALGDAQDIQVVGTAADGESGVAVVAELRPDVVLMDLRMPGGGGLPATTAIAATQPEAAVVVLTMSDDDSVFAALRAGARGYLLKESEGADIARAVRAAARSEAVFGPRIADRVLAFFASSRARSAAVPFPELTDREREVLDLVAHGLANAAIAARLFLSEKTVRNRVSDVLKKLHAASRAQAVALARDAGLGPAPRG
jgi:DNA-binding NarL/FixJ family response regulator